MEIRQVTQQNNDAIMDVWFASTVSGHPFLPESYWQERFPVVRDTYLPIAKTWGCFEGAALLGFISVVEESFIGGLFVHPNAQSKGIGARLLDAAKAEFPSLALTVYCKNTGAVRFYLRHGFVEEATQKAQDNDEMEYLLCWNAPQA